MPTPVSSFAFDESASLEDNLARFAAHLTQADAALGPELAKHFAAMAADTHDEEAVRDLLAATSPSPPSSAVAAPGPAATPQPAPTPPAAGPSPPAPNPITGWLLEGISIEGFRGVNNEGKPLDLKFHPNKVNSVAAVNGVGKSSVHDAVRYAITGRLPWLEDLPAAEREGDYYLNRFHSGRKATIKLRLVAEPTGAKCEITVVRDDQGVRTVSAPAPWDANAILAGLDREFVFLDGPTFRRFIADKPLERGRTFAGLLGLSAYSALRQALAGLAHAKAFNNHFEVTARTQALARERKAAADANAALATDFELHVGASLQGLGDAQAQERCLDALAQIAPLKGLCEAKTFGEVDIEGCIEAIKAAEGGPKRERLSACLRERAELGKLNLEAPSTERAKQLVSRAAERDEALAKTAGDLMLQLFQTGAKVVQDPDWTDPKICPLCDSSAPHDLRHHLAAKLAEFSLLDQAAEACGVEWGEAGWAELTALEAELQAAPEARLIGALHPRAEAGAITREEAQQLVDWLQALREQARSREEALATEQTQLEKELPQSSVEVTKKIETARRLQDNWRKLAAAQAEVSRLLEQEGRVTRVKTFLDFASQTFGVAESNLSKARLAAVEPVFKDYYKRMWFLGVEPAVAKRASSEDLQIRLADFHGQSNVSPQAVLSESFRNAFSISLYLAAASLFGGLPKFIILDDVTSSFDAGHQNYLVELIRTSYARPGNPCGPQVIMLSHDTMLEKLFNKHCNLGGWWHQRLEGTPKFAVLPQAGAVNKVREGTISMLQAGQVDNAKEGLRQYLEYRLSDLISRLRIPVPVDVAFNDNKQLAGEFLKALEAAVKLHQAAGILVLEPAQVAGLNANFFTITSNFLSHWGTGQTLTFTGASLLGVIQAIDDYCECFTWEPTPGAPRVYYRSLQQR
ncbi:hypothetical protein [Hansschlegelia beijingensis]|uniref:DNA repair exonuclease SbcCD ATPase subunit n=1 Tax=Hansschlegelia beijingensis TaxID=1133344 RepID=A0A7W6CX32_9HYPH|nr:hypothetical protein [Hansschlegelia beijingensis]MBB3971857.1 DNA repair exonuclease SbcCD ATPase subunit [Hansschlegelia beijingensis]